MVVDGKTLTLLRKDGKWVFPLVTYYKHGLGTPLCLALLAYVEDSNEFESEAVITVNLPGAERGAGCQFMTRTTAEKKFLAGLCFTACVLLPANTPFPVSASTPRWTFIRANASCDRKSFVTGISTSLIDRQEKAVIQDCLHGLACQCPFIRIPFRYFLPFLSGFPTRRSKVWCLCRSPPFTSRYGRLCPINGSLHHAASCRSFDLSKQPVFRYMGILPGCCSGTFRLLSAAFLSGPTASWANGDTFCLCRPSNLRNVTVRKSPHFVCPADRFFYPPKPSFLLSDAFYTGRWPIPFLFAIIACCHSLSATA